MKVYTTEEILKAAEIGEVSMIDANHIVSLLDEARNIIGNSEPEIKNDFFLTHEILFLKSLYEKLLKEKVEKTKPVMTALFNHITCLEKNIMVVRDNKKAKITPGYIKKTVCEYHNITESQLLSNTRKHFIVECRQRAIYFTRKYITQMSLNQIGQYYNLDHSTIIHCVKAVENDIFSSSEYAAEIKDIEEIINQI